MLQNVLSFLKKNLGWFQITLAVWQILKFTPLAAVIEGLMGSLLWLVLPGVFPDYKQLENFPGCLCKTVKCVVLSTGMPQGKSKQVTTSNMSKETILNGTSAESSKSQADSSKSQEVSSKPPSDHLTFPYLGKTFEVERKDYKVSVLEVEREDSKVSVLEVEREDYKVSVNREITYYMSHIQWNKICQMHKKCFVEKAGEGSEEQKKVVFVKGCKYIWQKVATGKVMEFEEVLDDIIFENNDSVLISNDVWFLPVDLSQKSEGKLAKLSNLVGLIPRVSKASFSVRTSLTIVAALLEFEPLRSFIYKKIDKRFCGLVQYICNKLPYPVRKCVYLLFIWVDNMKPRNDIRLKVERRDSLNVFIGGAAKTNSPQKPILVDFLEEKEEYEFRCGCSIVIKATYHKDTGNCKATVQHTNAVFGPERVFVKCEYPCEFIKIGTLLSCLAASKAGSLFKYDCNDNKVHVRGWRESLRHYKEAGFPEIYKLRLHDVIV